MIISSSNKNITGQLISVTCWKLCKHFKVIMSEIIIYQWIDDSPTILILFYIILLLIYIMCLYIFILLGNISSFPIFCKFYTKF